MSKSALPLTGKYCVLTGASRGLGAELAAAFWRSGANLLLVARSEDALRHIVDKLEKQNSQLAVPMAINLAAPESATAIERFARDCFPRLDVLINNAAGQGPIGPVWTNDWNEWVHTVQVDLLAPVALCRLLAPWMIREGGGRILNLSGGGATGPRPNFTAYATAKAGLVRFSETLAEELRPHKVWVNCIAPGPMNTSMLQEVLRQGTAAAGAREIAQALDVQQGAGAPMSRVAELCQFLTSSAADGITGKLISAVWDPWPELPRHLDELNDSDIYTLRRVVPKDRGKTWGGNR